MKINTKFFSLYTGNNMGTLIGIFGVYFAFNVWGNCFSPAFCFKSETMNPRGAALPIKIFTFTFRSKHQTETTFHLRTDFNFHWSFNWNSDHLARKFGTFHDTDFGGYWRWKSHVAL